MINLSYVALPVDPPLRLLRLPCLLFEPCVQRGALSLRRSQALGLLSGLLLCQIELLPQLNSKNGVGISFSQLLSEELGPRLEILAGGVGCVERMLCPHQFVMRALLFS